MACHWDGRKTLICMITVLLLDASGSAMESAGTLVDARHWGYTGRDCGQDVCTIADGSYFITGYFENRMTCPDVTVTTLRTFGSRDVFLARLNAEGKLLWIKSAGSSHCDEIGGVAALPDGTSFIVGSYGTGGANAIFGFGEENQTNLPPSNEYGVFFAKYYPDGRLQWARWAGGTEHDVGIHAAIAPDGSCYATGRSTQSATFGDPTMASRVPLGGDAAYSDFLVRYSSDGAFAWVKSGRFYGITALSDGCVIACRGDSLFLEAYRPDGSSLWTDSGISSDQMVTGACAVSNTRDFFAVVSYSAETFLRRYRVASDDSLGIVWETVVDNYVLSYPLVVRCRSNGESIVYNGFTGDLWSFEAEGSLLSTGTCNAITDRIALFEDRNECILTGGLWNTLTLGAGESNETTLTSFGADDMYEAHIRAFTRYEVNTCVVGEGCVLLSPSGGKYLTGTTVSVRATPTFPNHSEFLYWQGDGVFDGTVESVLSLTIQDEDVRATAVFHDIAGGDPLPLSPLAALVTIIGAVVLLSTKRMRQKRRYRILRR